MLEISVVICTYNRDRVLSEALSSFSSMDLPARDEIELLIVDNRSTDSTRTVATDFAKKNSYARYIYEPQQGLSHARNTGIRESHGKIIAFADDDVYFDPDWLNSVIRAFQTQPDADALGGKSIPLFENERPSWLDDDLLTIYGDTGFGDTARWLSYPEHPFGLNMAFRRHVFEQIGGFSSHLGRKKYLLLSNEESELFYRISDSGMKVYYTPDALLYHRIPKDRTTPRWFLRRHYWQGISDEVIKHFREETRRFVLLAEATSLAWQTLGQLHGGRLAPRSVFWHYRGISLRSKADLFYKLGRARQKLRMATSL